jgi:hypothetical protein
MQTTKAKLLDFLVIGAARSGTTTLFHHLRCHPQIYIPPAKELPFFSEEEDFSRGWDWFVKEFFAKAPPEALWGKISPQYMENPAVPERLFKTMPRVKLIALLRHPVDRAFSHYRFLLRRGKETLPFEEAFFAQGWRDYFYVRPGEYGRVLNQFLTYFPPEQLLILFTADLESQPQSVLDAITTHLGLEPGFSPPNLGNQYNRGGIRTRLSWLVPAVRKLLPLKWLWHTLPAGIRLGIGKWYFFEVAPVPEAPPAIPPDFRRKLVEFYRPEVLALADLIGRDVPWEEFYSEYTS